MRFIFVCLCLQLENTYDIFHIIKYDISISEISVYRTVYIRDGFCICQMKKIKLAFRKKIVSHIRGICLFLVRSIIKIKKKQIFN